MSAIPETLKPIIDKYASDAFKTQGQQIPLSVYVQHMREFADEVSAALPAQPKPEPVAMADGGTELQVFKKWWDLSRYADYPEHYPLITENGMFAAWLASANRFTSPPSPAVPVKPEPVRAALKAYAEASKEVGCPICNGTESCDHTVKERLLADLALPEVERLIELADKYKWQVRDTCARAEKAEAQVIQLTENIQSIAAQILALKLHPAAGEEYDAGYIAARIDAFSIVQEAIDNVV